MRLSLALILATTLAIAQERAPLPAELSLAAALRIALINSTVLQTAQANLDKATGQSKQSKSPLLPQVNINARQSYYTASLLGVGLDIPNLPSKIGPSAAMDARIGLTQDLFNMASMRDYKSFQSREESSRFLVNNARELVTLTVVSSYLDALRSKASRDSLVEQTQLARDLYQITRDRVTQGVSAELDANRALQQVNFLEQHRLEFEQSYVDAKLNLASILQARVTSDFEVADNAAYGDTIAPIADRNAAVQAAIAMRADYRSATANVRAAELRIDSVKAERYPTLKLTVDDGQSGSTPVHNINTYRVMGALQIPIFTGGRIEGQQVEAEGALREAKAALDETRSQIERDVLTAISGVEFPKVVSDVRVT